MKERKQEEGRSVKDATSVAPRDLILAKKFTKRLAEQGDPQLFQVTLFGSRARRDADEGSDCDFFVA
jgi:predicted nucleotidyltransferase